MSFWTGDDDSNSSVGIILVALVILFFVFGLGSNRTCTDPCA